MAFDGPSPFDGDPAFDFQQEVLAAPEDIEAIVEDALCAPLETEYAEIDEGVWAWIAAELLAHYAFGGATVELPDALTGLPVESLADLAPLARESLAAVADASRSELAQLWAEGYPEPLAERLAPLLARLAG